MALTPSPLLSHCFQSSSRDWRCMLKLHPRWVRRCLRLYLLLVLLGLAYVLYVMHQGQVQREFYARYFSRFHLNDNWVSRGSGKNGSDSECVLPELDPRDPAIKSFLRKVPPLVCPEDQLPITSMDEEGSLVLNITAHRLLKVKAPHVRCTYYEVWLEDDNHLAYGPPQVLRGTHRLKGDTCLVQCVSGATMWYEYVHIFPKPISFTPSPPLTMSPNHPPPPSIFILAVDSMSQPNFIRQLPKTYAYLTQKLDAVVMRGITKVGDNTFPNIIPLLTGLRVSTNDAHHEFKWPRREFAHRYMDQMPLLWHVFRDAGYATMYAEDMPQYALFNYPTLGFKQQPVDYYMRPFWMASENTTVHRKGRYLCFGSRPKHQLILEYAKRFLRAQREEEGRYFGFSFVSEVSHGDINQVQVIDQDMMDMLKGAVDGGLLDKTLLIVMGDHGNRFDAIRSTIYGRLEERMPFLSIIIPKWMQAIHPHLKPTLVSNSHSLISWFDIHEMLRDVLERTFEQPVTEKSSSRYGIPLWRQQVSKNRTCADAGVLPEYCVCVAEEPLPNDDDDVIRAAEALVDHVNAMLEPISEWCYMLQLKRVLTAVVVLPSYAVSGSSPSSTSLVVQLRVSVETSPNSAHLEALLQRSAFDPFEVVGDVNRINRYGSQASCLKHAAVLRLYCLCKDKPTVVQEEMEGGQGAEDNSGATSQPQSLR